MLINELLGDEARAENSSIFCEWMLWYCVFAYSVVALIALIMVWKGIHTSFVWCTLSTLVMFNVLL